MRAPALFLLLALAQPARALELDLRSPWIQGPDRRSLRDERASGGDKLRLETTTLMIVAAAVLAGWDIYLAITHRTTESRIITDFAWQHPSAVFLAGALAGHLFLNTPWAGNRLVPWGFIVLAAVLAYDLTSGGRGPTWTHHPGVWFVVGMGSGAAMWGQHGRT